MIRALEALSRLREGNRRFVTEDPNRLAIASGARRRELASGQEPFAIIVGCSDSRVPAELIFDHGFGDLFVIRIAGNIVSDTQIASVEFAAEQFGTRLVVVLGHSRCGAVTATLAELGNPSRDPARHLLSIVTRIQPAVDDLLRSDLAKDPEALLAEAVRANVRASANQLRHRAPLLEGLIRDDALLIVGAEYSLETGIVDFFDGVPEMA